MLKRVGLFVLTNILVMTTISIAYNLFVAFTGINQYRDYYIPLLVFCIFWGFGGAFISLLMSKWIAKKAYNVQIIDPAAPDTRARELVFRVHSLARKAGLEKMPEVGVYDSPEINAFATGPSRNNSLVAISTGLLNRMNDEEVNGVLGHEVTHIANGDMVTMTLIQGVVNSFVMFFARIIARLVASQSDEKNQYAIQFALTIVLDIVFSLLGSIVVATFSRYREFRADAGGAKLAGRQAMINGLRRLQAQFEQIAPDNTTVANLKISNKPSGVLSLFSTHPPLEERIARLEKAYLV